MLETTRFDVRRRGRGTAALTIVVACYAAFIVWYFSVLEDVDYEELVADFPPALTEAFGIEAMGTIEGFLGTQLFNFVWILALGLYFAYVGGGLLAGEIERERMDLLLSFPIARSRLLIEKVVALLVPILVLNTVIAIVIYGFVAAIGESIDVVHLALAHLLSIPYLLVCLAIGVLLSTLFDRAALAQRAAVGIVFGLFLLESVVGSSTDVAWVRFVSPTYYYDPTTVMIDGTFAATDVTVLLIAVVTLLGLGIVQFERRDV